MAALQDIYLKLDTLETLVKTIKAKQEKGIAITISVNDETNQYGQNISAYVSQSKAEREAQKDRYYVGNGKVFWTDGKCTVAERKEQPQQANVNNGEDSLPF